jgi:CelD/BcsL family acetyltransferase involved in cellulose biosynthesis
MPARQFNPVAARALPAADSDYALSIEILVGGAARDLLKSEAVRQLSQRPGNGFQHGGFLGNGLRTAADRMAVVVATRRGRLTSVWPLRFEHRYGLRIASDLAAPFAQYSDVIGEPLDADAFRAAGTRLRDEFGVDAVLCRGVRRDSGLAKALAGRGVVERSAAPFIDLRAYATFETYCGRFSKQTTRTRRQRRKKLEARHGPLGFIVLNGKQGRDAVAQALRWKRDWLATNGLSSRLTNARDLQTALLEAIDDPEAHVSVLSVQERPIAVELGFSCAGNYAAFLGAFDPDYATYSPGQEQMLLTIEWCYAQRFSRYDLLPPRDAYKLHWAGDEEAVSDHCVPLSPTGSLYLFARRYARTPIKRTILGIPAELRVVARRYGPAAAGIGATATTIGILAD